MRACVPLGGGPRIMERTRPRPGMLRILLFFFASEHHQQIYIQGVRQWAGRATEGGRGKGRAAVCRTEHLLVEAESCLPVEGLGHLTQLLGVEL